MKGCTENVDKNKETELTMTFLQTLNSIPDL